MPSALFRRHLLATTQKPILPALVITPIGVVTADAVNDTTVTLTLTVGVAAGETIVVASAAVASPALSSVTDTAGNTYTLRSSSVNSTSRVRFAYVLNPAALSIGQSINGIYASANAAKTLMAWKLSRTATLSLAGANASGSTSPARTPMGWMPQNAAVFGSFVINAAVNPTNPSSPWSSDGVGQVGSKGYAFAHLVAPVVGGPRVYEVVANANAWAASVQVFI